MIDSYGERGWETFEDGQSSEKRGQLYALSPRIFLVCQFSVISYLSRTWRLIEKGR
jgi:hypothetical protein